MQLYQQLEKEFCSFTGKKYAVAVNSGTSALHLALLALGIGKGDEVIVPDLTFAACAFAVSYTGANPIFVDCRDDLNIDPDLIEEKITKRTKAIMAVHIYGRKCQMDKIIKIARKHKLKVIEDLSEAHGIKPTGDIGCYSFQASKIINAEEGGMVVTNNKQEAYDINEFKGYCNDGNYFHDRIGFNYRMPNSQAKLALKSLHNFDKNIKKRNKEISKIEEWIPQENKMPKRDVPWVYDFIEKERDETIAMLKDCGITARPFFKPMSTLPMYKRKPGKNALKYSKIGIVIPL